MTVSYLEKKDERISGEKGAARPVMKKDVTKGANATVEKEEKDFVGNQDSLCSVRAKKTGSRRRRHLPRSTNSPQNWKERGA